jgi:uncharacterized protein YraI
MTTIKTISAALAAVALSAGVAAAASATTDVNLRAGPGPDYQAIGVIPAGAPVAVMGCSGSWCQVNYAGRAGYASASYLSGDGDGSAAIMTPRAQVYGSTTYAPRAYGPTAYGPAVSGPSATYVDRGYAPYDSYASSDAYDDDGYPSAESFHFSFSHRQPYDRGWIGHQDW